MGIDAPDFFELDRIQVPGCCTESGRWTSSGSGRLTALDQGCEPSAWRRNSEHGSFHISERERERENERGDHSEVMQ